MAERRMFAKTIIDSDAFVELPLSAQALYFHLSMRADDDGFVNNPRRIQNDVGAAADDLKLLIAKRFVLSYESGVLVIKHWRIHNYIRQDRYKPTVYVKEKSLLVLSENGAYTEKFHEITDDSASGIPLGDRWLPQGSLEVKSKDKDNTTTTTTTPFLTGASAPAREERETGGGMAPPTSVEVYAYMTEELGEEYCANEASKFVAWNTVRGWDCLPNWKAAAALWCERISERGK